MDAPTRNELRETAQRIAPHIVRTPTISWPGPAVDRLPPGTDIQLKLECFQRSGTFKARGTITNMLRLSTDQLKQGVTAVSAGNHAVSVAYAAERLGTSAKVVMLATANSARVDLARAYGAEVINGGDGPSSFALAEQIAKDEGRFFVPPFEGKEVALGAGTIALELYEDAPELDAVVVAVGGGGLAGGLAAGIHQFFPRCQVYGVEPEGSDGMRRSIALGSAHVHNQVSTIADSLAPPMTLPYSFGLCERFLTDVVTVTDDEICEAMSLLFAEAKLAVEPAAAAATAACFAPLRDRLAGKRVGIIVCGANIDAASFSQMLSRATR